MSSVDVALVILRVCLGLTMAAHGYNKLAGGIDGTARWFDGLGMKPGIWHARLAAGSEISAGVGVVLGLCTPIGAAGFVALMIVAGWTVHRGNGFFIVKNGWEYNLVLAICAVALAGLGPGSLSLDAALFPHDWTSGWIGMGTATVLGIAGGLGQLVLFYRPAQSA